MSASPSPGAVKAARQLCAYAEAWTDTEHKRVAEIIDREALAPLAEERDRAQGGAGKDRRSRWRAARNDLLGGQCCPRRPEGREAVRKVHIFRRSGNRAWCGLSPATALDMHYRDTWGILERAGRFVSPEPPRGWCRRCFDAARYHAASNARPEEARCSS